MGDIQRTPYSRVFLIEDRAGPANVPDYMGLSRAMAFTWPQGDITPVRIPSESNYGQFKVIDQILGAQGLPQLPIQTRYTRDLSDLLRIIRKGCPVDIQVHMGACQDVRDFNGGWDKILVLEEARASQYGTTELGALDQGEDAVVNEETPFTGMDAYEIKPLAFAEYGSTEVVMEVIAVALCDSKTCGACGLPSDGCQHVFAIQKSTTASPGLPGELIYSSDGWATLGQTIVDTLAANKDASDMACVGINLVVISFADDSLHYAPIADILAGAETWSEVLTGIVAAGSPQAIFSFGTAFTWVVGEGGYIYFSDDITAGLTVQSAGTATVQNLAAIHGYDELNLVAVGAANAVVHTANGGLTWSAVTGPAPAIALTAVWMRSETEWFVGTAGGALWYTRDSGASWVQKRFTGDNVGSIADIFFSTPTVGYMSHTTVAPAGRILRTIDGGHSWYILPEGTGVIPTTDKLNSIVGCGEDPNVLYAGGLAADGTDGVLIKAA